MPPTVKSSTEQLAELLRQCLREGATVEIEGLGKFGPTQEGGFEFLPAFRPKVFIAYAEEDHAAAGKLFDHLLLYDFDPWLDTRRLLPGQNWPRAIEQAIELSDFVITCFSRSAVFKRGHFQCELRYALDCARRLPLDQTFLIPVRLDQCSIPPRITRSIQYVDLFPDWYAGFRRVLSAMRRQMRRAKARDRNLRLVG